MAGEKGREIRKNVTWECRNTQECERDRCTPLLCSISIMRYLEDIHAYICMVMTAMTAGGVKIGVCVRLMCVCDWSLVAFVDDFVSCC